MKILVRSPNWIGDQIMAYPFFYYLRQCYPQAHIVVACLPWVKSLQYRNLIDDIYEIPPPITDHLLGRLSHVWQSGQWLREQKGSDWDLGIALPLSFSSALFLYKAGARRRRGFAAELRTFMLNEKVDWKKAKDLHRSQAYLQLLTEISAPALQEAKDFWQQVQNFQAQQSWAVQEPYRIPTMPYWVLAPGAQAESRRWPLERYAELVRGMEGEWPHLRCLVVGGKNEMALAESLKKDYGLPILDYTARSTVAELCEVFSHAQLTISNDSGLAHVASICGSAVQVIWGAGDPHRTLPKGPGQVMMRFNPVECWPCEKNHCPLEGENHLQCLKGIHAADVFRSIKEGFGTLLDLDKNRPHAQ